MSASDTTLFGLTLAQRMAEDSRKADIAFGNGGCMPSHCAVRSHEEAADYTAEIMADIGAEHCAICGRFYLPIDDCLLCGNCLAYENQAWADYQDDVAVALAATNGTL